MHELQQTFLDGQDFPIPSFHKIITNDLTNYLCPFVLPTCIRVEINWLSTLITNMLLLFAQQIRHEAESDPIHYNLQNMLHI